MAASSSFTKTENLSRPADYIRWRRRVCALILRGDPGLQCFGDPPQNTSSLEYTSWQSYNTKETSAIILCLGDSAHAKTHTLVDDSTVSAKLLWKELCRIFTSSSTQAIADFQAKFEGMLFDETDD